MCVLLSQDKNPYTYSKMTIMRQNALSVKQWMAIVKITCKPQVAGVWDIDWSDESSDAES